MIKRTTQKLTTLKLGKDTITMLSIKDLKKNTVMSKEATKADWIYISILGSSFEVMAQRKGDYFEVKTVDEEIHITMACIGMTSESSQVKAAESFVAEWLKSQRTN